MNDSISAGIDAQSLLLNLEGVAIYHIENR
jgi:hypothetical protein